MSRVRWIPLSVFLGAALVLTFPGDAAPQPEPQQRPIDRRAYLNDVQTSDDPRRVPAPPGPRGPEGTTVLRGGLVFDGTGSEPAAGTVVMERNRIAAVLPEGVTDWPEGARVLDVSGHTVLPGLMDLHTHLTLHRTRCAAGADGAPGARRAAGRRTSPRLHRLRNHLGARHLLVRNRAVHLERVGPGQPAPGPAGLRRRATDHRDRRPQRRGVVRPLGGVRSGRRGVGGRRIPGRPSGSSSSAAPI